MSYPNRVIQYNNPANSQSFNQPNFGYASRQRLEPIYSPKASSYNPGNINSNSYQVYHGNFGNRYGNESTGLGYSNYGIESKGENYGYTHLHIQPGNSNQNYGVIRDIHHPAPVTKINFGNKNYTETYAQNPIAPIRSIQTHQVYKKPVSTSKIRSPPLRQQFRKQVQIQPKVEQSAKVDRSAVSQKRIQRKGNCPVWVWPLLCVLTSLLIILGLLVGMGTLGRLTGPSKEKGAGKVGKNSQKYTVIEETVILSKDNSVANNNPNLTGASLSSEYVKPSGSQSLAITSPTPRNSSFSSTPLNNPESAELSTTVQPTQVRTGSTSTNNNDWLQNDDQYIKPYSV